MDFANIQTGEDIASFNQQIRRKSDITTRELKWSPLNLKIID